MKLAEVILSFTVELIAAPPRWMCRTMRFIGEMLVIAAFSSAVAMCAAYVLEEDGRQLRDGEVSPHSGFCPDYPTWDGGQQ